MYRGKDDRDRDRKRVVVSIPDEPFFMLKPNDDPSKNLTGNDRYMGYCVDLAEHISKIVNFTYEFRVVKDNKFGAQSKAYRMQQNQSHTNIYEFYYSKTKVVIGME